MICSCVLYLCCVLLVFSFVGFSCLTAVALLGFPSVLLGCECRFVGLSRRFLWLRFNSFGALLGFVALLGSHSALLGSVLFLYGVLSVSLHARFYRFVGRVLSVFLRLCTFVWIFDFPGFCFTLKTCNKLSLIFSRKPFHFHQVFVSLTLIVKIFFPSCQRNWGVSIEKNHKIHNLIRVSSTASLTDFC